MARRKKNRKSGKAARTQSGRQSWESVTEQVESHLARENGRLALDLLRAAQHRHGDRAELPFLFFCACTLRARELTAKGLADEARSMSARAREYGSSFDPSSLGAEQLTLYLRAHDLVDAMAAYAGHCARDGPVPELERMLADIVVVERKWDALETLAGDHALRRDAAVMASALEAMDAGEWNAAGRCLRPLGRHSPFGPWKLFCKAMVAFEEERDDDLRKLLGLLPADFPLPGTVAELKRAANGGGEPGPPPIRHALGTTDVAVHALATRLRDRVVTGTSLRSLADACTHLADAIGSADSCQSRIAVLQIVARAMLDDFGPDHEIDKLASRVLPANLASSVVPRLYLMEQSAMDMWDPYDVSAYFQNMSQELPDPADRAMARACVLDKMARRTLRFSQGSRRDYEFCLGCLDQLEHFHGEKTETPEEAAVALMQASLAEDPDNRPGFLFVLDTLRKNLRDRRSREPVRQTLKSMAEAFPEDSFPWLELARDLYATNAYRRAEEALAEAVERAPHDDRVLDLQAIGCLRSADRSRQAGRFSTAARDIARAADMNRRTLADTVFAKKLLLELAESDEDGGDIVRRGLEPHPLLARARIAQRLGTDLCFERQARHVTPEQTVAARAFLATLDWLVAELPPSSVIEFLREQPPDHLLLHEINDFAAIAMELWPDILSRFDGDLLFEALENLLVAYQRKKVREELHRRLDSPHAAADRPLFLFYLAYVRYIEGFDFSFRRFRSVVDSVDAAGERKLREAARRLAPRTREPLRTALVEFDFKRNSPVSFLDSLPEISPFADDPPVEDAGDDQTNPLSDLENAVREELGADFDDAADIRGMPKGKDLTASLIWLEVRSLGANFPSAPRKRALLALYLIGTILLDLGFGLLDAESRQLGAQVSRARLKLSIAHFLDDLGESAVRHDLLAILPPAVAEVVRPRFSGSPR